MSTTPQGPHDPILLTTDDTPPTSHIVSRSRLITLSPFFSDMLSLPLVGPANSGRQDKVPLTDPLKKLKGLLMILQGREDELSMLDQQDWINLAASADKYDCRVAKKEAEMQMWKWIAGSKYAKAFHLAVELDDEAGVKATWVKVVDAKTHLSLNNEVWKKRIENSLRKRVEKVRDLLLNSRPDHNANCECDQDVHRDSWRLAAYEVLRSYQSSVSVETQLRKALNSILDDQHWSLCYLCIQEIVKTGKDADSAIPKKLELGDA